MAVLGSIKLDLNKISKERVYKGKKGSYYTVTFSINDETSEWGDNISVWEEQTQEERESKSPKKYLGNGKVFWKNDNPVELAEKKSTETTVSDDGDDDFPF